MDNFQPNTIDIKTWSCIDSIVPHSSQTSEGGVNMECMIIGYIGFLYTADAVELRDNGQKPGQILMKF